jgi:hypothetical protein
MASNIFLNKAFMAYFGRPADLSAVTDFASVSEAQVQQSFAASAESRDLFGDTFNAKQINSFYQALFGRDAEQAGIDYWLDRVNDGTYTKAGASIAILEGAQNADAVAIANKLLTSSKFTSSLSPDKTLYAGTADAILARDFLKTISEQNATQAQIDKILAEIEGSSAVEKPTTPVVEKPSTPVVDKNPGNGQTFTLTAGTDTIPGLIGSNETRSTTGDDVISAFVNSTDSTTLNSTDNLNAGDGIDVLNIRIVPSNQDIRIAPTLSNVEKISVLNEGLTASKVTLDLTSARDVTTIDASKMTLDLEVNAAASTASGFTYSGGFFNDRLILGTNTLNASGKLNDDSGKNTIVTTSFADVATAVNRATGFQVLEATNDQTSLDASSFTTINEFLFSGVPSTLQQLNITGVESDDRFIFSNDQSSNGTENVQFTGKNAGESVVFEMRASAENNGEVSIGFTSAGNFVLGNASAVKFQNEISSVTVDSTGANAAANSIQGNGGVNDAAFNNDNGLTNFKITGSQSLSIMAVEGKTMFADARGFTKAVNVDASSFTGNLRIAGSNSDDTIIGGSGNDIIYALNGGDTLTGNGGADQFRVVGSNQGTSRITDFSQGVDKLGLTNNNASNTTATTAGTILSAQDYVETRNLLSDITLADNNKVIELQSDLSASFRETGKYIYNYTGAAISAYVFAFDGNRAVLYRDDNWSDTTGRRFVAEFQNIASPTQFSGFKNTDFVEFLY